MKTKTYLPLLVLALGLARALTAAPTTLKGTLYYPFAAIGGETTGFAVVDDSGKSTDLEFTDEKTMQYAQTLNAWLVEVTGELKVVHGIEIPDREVLVVSSIKALTNVTVCDGDSAYTVAIDANWKKASVSKEARRVADLECAPTNTGVSCYEPNLRDAGYALNVWLLSPTADPSAKLFEVYIWGQKEVASLTCHTR